MGTLAATFILKMYPASIARKLTGNPKRMTSPRLAPRIPAAAMGPGVGGTRQCVDVSPRLNAIAGAASVIFADLESALFSGESITKPESAYTGRETIQPTRAITSGTRFLPIILNMLSARLYAPPEFSRKVPIIVPATITMPI